MRRLALLATVASACATGAEPGPAPRPPPPSCDSAEAPLHEVDRFLEAGRPTCAALAVAAAARACPSLGPSLDARLRELASKLVGAKPDRLALSPQARFALQEVGRETRVFDLRGERPALSFRLEATGVVFLSDALLGVDLGVDAAIVQLERGTLHAMADTWVIGATEAHVYVATPTSVVRLDATDLGGRLAIERDRGATFLPGPVTELERVVVLPSAVVGFGPPRIVAAGARPPSISKDRRWVALCDPKTEQVVVVRASDGALVRRAAVRANTADEDPRACERTSPEHDPSGRSLVWFSVGPAGDGGPIQVAVMDVETGSVRRFEDRSATWNMLAIADPFFDPQHPDRICARYRAYDSTQQSESCHLRLATGQSAPDPATGVGSRDIRAVLPPVDPGARPWTSATSPTGRVAATLLARREGGARVDVRLTIRDEASHALREILLPDARYEEGSDEWAPWIDFYDEDHLLLYGEDRGPSFVVDRTTEELMPLGMASIEGPVLRLGTTGIFDPRAWRRSDLGPGIEGWSSAPILLRDRCSGP